MKRNHKIRSLHLADEKTANTIMEEHPAQWDMDAAFQKAYSGYLAQQTESARMDELTETVSCVKENGMTRRIAAFAGLAAAIIGCGILAVHLPPFRQQQEKYPTESDVLLQAASQESTTAQSTTTSKATTTSTEQTTTEPNTELSHTTQSETSFTASETTASSSTTPPAQTSTAAAESTTQTSAAVTESTEGSTTQTEVTSTESTTSSTEQTIIVPSENLQGEFGIAYFSGDHPTVVFRGNGNKLQEEHSHTFAAEGFTVTGSGIIDDLPSYMSYTVESATGTTFTVRQFSDLNVGFGFQPESNYDTLSFQIDGKPCYLVYDTIANENLDCLLAWFDGCHICCIYAQEKHLPEMELLVQSQVTY